MTDSQHDIPDTDKDVDVLAKKLDGTNADKAAAIAQFVDGRIATALEPLKADIRRLIDGQRDVKQRAEELPPADKAAVAPQVNDASRQAREVAKDANDIEARQQAGEKVDPQEIQDLDQRASQARQSSDQARESVDRRAAAAARAREEHEAQQASRSKQPASDPAPSRDADKGDGNYVTQPQLTAALDQVYAHVSGVDATAIRALAIARASASSVAPLRRAATWAMIAFVAVAVLYLLITGLTPIEHVWRDNFAWAFGVAFIAYCAGVITAKDASVNAEARSEAHAGHQDDAGLDIVDRRDQEDQHPQYPGHARSPQATADAHASAR